MRSSVHLFRSDDKTRASGPGPARSDTARRPEFNGALTGAARFEEPIDPLIITYYCNSKQDPMWSASRQVPQRLPLAGHLGRRCKAET